MKSPTQHNKKLPVEEDFYRVTFYSPSLKRNYVTNCPTRDAAAAEVRKCLKLGQPVIGVEQVQIRVNLTTIPKGEWETL